jgi:hypothetical protein
MAGRKAETFAIVTDYAVVRPIWSVANPIPPFAFEPIDRPRRQMIGNHPAMEPDGVVNLGGTLHRQSGL